MKKIITLFAIVGLIVFSSCEGDEGPPGPPGLLSYVFEVNKVNFSATSNSQIYVDFDSRIYSGDVILVYRYDGADPATGRDIWVPLPESHYYSNGSLYFAFKFDFTQDNVRIFTEGFGLAANPIPADFVVDQIFRIVIVPGDDGINTKKSVNKPDYSDYNAVIKKYNIDDSNVKKLN
ncbi:hypothetical protein OIU80_00755 [Flavobacterium sp. LS1R47]|uniref:Uncharacterized protein n=1 Tax=Flavobacterium frigoritolerans TaxID=2987686 RepID=A0A9X2YXP1_9FLAO|nr:hypothetical protein [Flavobacterium frigoritolerans]MCV9930798.1 hypothetical protein [Flavobacterium frigoritolerans]